MQNYAYQTDLFNRKKNPFTREYKVYHDGSHYIARESVKGRNRTVTRRGRSALITLFDILYDETIKNDIATDEEKKRYITDKLINDYCVDITDVDIFVEENFGRKTRNIWQREKRFRRKAYLNRWNYFVTFTYDGKKHTEETFIKRLRKCLANLHTRRGWRYMGVTERGEESGRFHYHFLMYIPDGQMVGKLYKKRDYSKKRGTVQETISNEFFERKFGRNDFQEIIMNVNGGNAVEYCLKYMRKTNTRGIYSRGIPTELTKRLDKKYDFAAEIVNDKVKDYAYYAQKWVLFDGIIDYDRDIRPLTLPKLRLVS